MVFAQINSEVYKNKRLGQDILLVPTSALPVRDADQALHGEQNALQGAQDQVQRAGGESDAGLRRKHRRDRGQLHAAEERRDRGVGHERAHRDRHQGAAAAARGAGDARAQQVQPGGRDKRVGERVHRGGGGPDAAPLLYNNQKDFKKRNGFSLKNRH